MVDDFAFDEVYDSEGFMEYLEQNFVGFDGVEGSFLREMCRRLIFHGLLYEPYSEDFVEYLASILPAEVSKAEIRRFVLRHGRW